MSRAEAYSQAEQRIEEAQTSWATELDLSGIQLYELPESLEELTELQSLDISSNELRNLPEWLGTLTELQSLDLSDNQLTELPEWLSTLTELQSLDLSGNQVAELPESLGQLTQLRELYLADNHLIVLPEWLGQLTNLVHLGLGSSDRALTPGECNHLKDLPKGITNLRKLESLSLDGNEFSKLPQHIFKLSGLITLRAISNRIGMIPVDIRNLTNLADLNLNSNEITELPKEISELKELKLLAIGPNQLTASSLLTICKLEQLTGLFLQGNPFETLPEEIGYLSCLKRLSVWGCGLTSLPRSLAQLEHLEELSLEHNSLTDLPPSLADLEHLETLDLKDNPLNPELAAAYKEGLASVKAYLRAKAGAQITLNEAKLILVGEGEVGKSCLLGALRGDQFVEGLPTTHGIEIKSVEVTDHDSNKRITLNGWDFGGQRVYRPTHQLFFSSPAVYLVVWKPREGPQQGFVKEWIKLVKHREPDAKILVVATHGGPQQRQPDIDRQELWDLFGQDTVIDFFHVDSKPDKEGNRGGIEELKKAIARVASKLPEMGRTVPKSWQDARKALQKTKKAYLPLEDVFKLCLKHKMDDEQARLFVTISHRLGHLIHYEHDPALRDIVVLKPDWLATAVSFVLDDKETRKAHGLVPFSRLGQLWNDQTRPAEFHYPAVLHPIFLRLMERFDLSYRVAGLPSRDDSDPSSLIAQLVPDNRPERDLERAWPLDVAPGDVQQVQICRIVDEKGQSATAEGLFYQLIVRLHKYSLGRVNFKESVHWQRGLVLDNDYNGRAVLEHVGNDVHITVRAPYPERFLAMLTSEVKYLVESFWEGLRCDVMVSCIDPCGINDPGTGLFEVEKLIDSKRKNRPDYPCPVCNEWQNINLLLRNAPASRPVPTGVLIDSPEVLAELRKLRGLLVMQHDETKGRFDTLDAGQRELLSKADASYNNFMQALTDEAKEGPRLFSFVPVGRSNFNPRKWTRAKFRLTLWCEHSRLPLPSLNGNDRKKGVYEIELTREWFKKAGPYLKLLTGTLSLVLPVASSAVKLALDETAYKAIEEQLDFGQKVIAATIGAGAKIGEFMGAPDATTLEHSEATRAQGANLRELHALLKAKDPGFGGLVRVRNKRQEFLWVHPQFEKEY